MYFPTYDLTRDEKQFIRSLIEEKGWRDVRFLSDGRIVGRKSGGKIKTIASVDDDDFKEKYGRYVVYYSYIDDKEFDKYFKRREAILQARHFNNRTDYYGFVIDRKTGKKL